MPEVLLLLVCGAAAILVFYLLVPWMGRRVSVYEIHDARDRLYALRARHPQLAKSYLYWHAEFIVSATLLYAREKSFVEVVSLSHALGAADADPSNIKPEHVPALNRMEAELAGVFSSGEGAAVAKEIDLAVRSSKLALTIRMITAHPLLLTALFLVLPLAVIAGRNARRASRGESPSNASRKPERIPQVPLVAPPPPRDPRETARLIFRTLSQMGPDPRWPGRRAPV